MILHPIFMRELKRAVRNPVLYWLRAGTVVVGVAFGVVVLRGTALWSSGAAAGRDIFQFALWIAIAACLLSGVLATAGLLCEERRQGSLALLFLTRVRGIDILLGKLGAMLLLSCQVVLGLFPVLALCMVLGGVSLAEFGRAVQLLLTALIFSLCAGLFVSALNKYLSRSVLISFAAVLATTFLAAWGDWSARTAIGLPVSSIVPGLIPALFSLPDAVFALPPQGFNSSLQFQLALSLALLLLGGLMLKRLSISDGVNSAGRLLKILSPRERAHRRAALRHNPIHWAAQRHRWRWLVTWLVFCALILLWTAALHIFDFSRQTRVMAIFLLAPLLHLLLKAAIAAEAVERLGSARSGELELLLVTPISDNKLLRGHSKALLRQFAWPIATMVMIDLLFAFCYSPPNGEFEATSLAGYLFIYALGLSLVLDCPALIARGLWNGLRCRTAVQAVRLTLLEVVAAPLPFLALSFFAILLFLQIGSRPLALVILVAWGVIAFVCSALAQRNAEYNLHAWLRYIAADPAGARAKIHRRSSQMFAPRNPQPDLRAIYSS